MKRENLTNLVKLCIGICVFLSFSTFAQQIQKSKPSYLSQKKSKVGFIRCATTENEERLQLTNPKRMNKSQFENWISPIIAKQKQNSLTNKTGITIYTIPVVIHIIHNGDPINTISSHTSENISDAQAASQITVLNQDFRKMAGTPGFGNTGYKLGVDCLINFVLAKQDPYGVLTTGIEHINLGKENWNEVGIDILVKPETQWDPSKYLNIWVVNFSNQLLGYAQFPSNSNLSGLNSAGGDIDTDGIVIKYNAMGTIAENDGSFELNSINNMGRTATHEIGHFLGLRHIWGDDELCTGNNSSTGDFVSDTPDSNKENYECTSIPAPANCIGNDMTENYMDYTNDACLNTFTAGQKSRMVAVMTNSPRRKELASSTVASPGFVKSLDGALRNIIITNSVCNSSFTPSIKIENKGTNTIQTATITYRIDNANPKTYIWNGTLLQNQSDLINIPEIVSSIGTHLFTAEITNINNSTDQNIQNDSASKSYTILPISQLSSDATPKVTLTLQCDRDGSETTWTLKNSSGTTLYSGGPYEDAVSSTKLKDPITQIFNLPAGDCYTFTINDSYGDGINTNGGLGSYSLKDENNITFASGSTFIFSESKGFSFGSLDNSSFETSTDVYLFPNPTKGSLNINLPTAMGLPNSYYIANSQGKIIHKKEVLKNIDLNVNTASLSSGIYYITIKKGIRKRTLKFVKE
jgi:hypothetical protein